jgi:hypothetical protein
MEVEEMIEAGILVPPAIGRIVDECTSLEYKTREVKYGITMAGYSSGNL